MANKIGIPFDDIVKESAQQDPVFRELLLPSTIDLFLGDEVPVGKISLRQTIDATIGYEKLAKLIGKSPDDIKQMLHPDYDTSVNDLFEIIKHIQKHEGIRLDVKVCSGEQDCDSVSHDEPAETVEAREPLHPVSPS